jgi:site-specific DNA-adenine methylase
MCKETWQNVDDIVERAGRWYYMVQYSFGKLGRNWGRATSPRGNIAGTIQGKLPLFNDLHNRMRRVQFENRDALKLLEEYDSSDAVFYLDPPYIDAHKGTYKFEMTNDEHKRMIDIIFNMDAFVAVSGYSNPLYDNQNWDIVYEWDAFVSIDPINSNDDNKRGHIKDVKRSTAKETLWIKGV